MVAIKNTIVGLVVAVLASSAAADKCKAKGTISRGATKVSSGFSVYRGDDRICSFDGDLKCGTLPNGNENVIKSCDDLKHPVSFHADCPNYKFE
ncbi:hypothetical protein N7492_004705 [Penicillium capsulatum]|uniref:Uncharacterized protein n=1 Tax=Penicillium capsulatum TaxID=69766 RepID=A0A9W9IEF5_9EURO|nr:hypothetical protein N7492_004705 [Penicillium capsulatum]KAJ6136188.1 hypothetical protein N7512_001348 [Penicillium capsulatum]